MEELKNLKEICSAATNRFNKYDNRDFIMPLFFKEQVKEINSSIITYNDYSAVIETRGNHNGELKIFMPNQWFYIASYFTDLYNELQKYKIESLKVVSKERLKNLNGSTLTDNEMSKLNALQLSDDSKSYLVKFITDYSWWNGAKTIDRGDFYVSPILNCARLVNASQSYIADLCAFLADKKELINAIISCEEDAITNRSDKTGMSYQKIYYGAPGTGKSYIVNRDTKRESVIRTTFHPDSDYSTFVGCYKPTMAGGACEIVQLSELKKNLFNFKLDGGAYPCQRFAAKYWKSLQSLSSVDIKDILNDCGFTDSMATEIAKGISVGKDMSATNEERIVYEFVDQAFLKAYIKAWRFYAEAEEGTEPKKQFLIVEEINRGNCAQIFGDLFQLLDRNNYGFSDYYIHADRDMQKHLAKAFKDFVITDSHKDTINAMYHNGESDIVAKVLSGEILLLPNNLYIWATMNTSDQSLFPIDSAFKRRWDWEYEPIKYKNTNWIIDINGNKYSWVSFQRVINKRIYDATSSEDKMLGDYFVNPTDGIVTERILLNKILFYLWNDVCKDGEGDIFKTNETTDISFSELHGEGGSEKLVAMMKYLGVSLENNTIEENLDIEQLDQESKTWYLNLWTDIRKSLENNGQQNLPNARDRQTYQLSVGLTGISVLANIPKTKANGFVCYYVEKQQANDIYPKLLNLKDTIENSLGELEWHREDNKYGIAKRNIELTSINDSSTRNELIEQISKLLIDFKATIIPLVDQLR